MLEKVMWFLWMLCVCSQWLGTFLALVCLVLAYMNLEAQYHSCMTRFGGGADAWALFNAVLPSALVHPALISRQMAMVAYFFALLQGFEVAGYKVDTTKFAKKPVP